MATSDETLMTVAATLTAAIVQAEIASRRMHLDSEGATVYVMDHYDVVLERLRGQRDRTTETTQHLEDAQGKPAATIDIFGPDV